ncbi:unnamed protein product [Arctogadus glacialis]
MTEVELERTPGRAHDRSHVCYRERRSPRAYWLGHSRPTTATSVTGRHGRHGPTGSVTAGPPQPRLLQGETVATGLLARSQQAHDHSPVCYRERRSPRAYWLGHSRPTTATSVTGRDGRPGPTGSVTAGPPQPRLLQGDTVATGLLARSQQAHHSHVCYRETRSPRAYWLGHSRPTTATSVTGRHGRHGPTGSVTAGPPQPRLLQGETVAQGLLARSQQAHHSHVCYRETRSPRAYWLGHSRPTTATSVTGRHGRHGPTGSVTAGPPQPRLLQGETVAQGLLARSQQAHHSHVCYRETRSPRAYWLGHSRPTTAPSVTGRDGRPGPTGSVTAGPPQPRLLQGETVATGLLARSQQAHHSPVCYRERRSPRAYWLGHSRPTTAPSVTGRDGRPGPTGSVTAGPPQPRLLQGDTVAQGLLARSQQAHHSPVCYRERRSPRAYWLGHSRPTTATSVTGRDGRPGPTGSATAGPPQPRLLQGETVATGLLARSQQAHHSPVCYRERRSPRAYWLGHSRPTTATGSVRQKALQSVGPPDVYWGHGVTGWVGTAGQGQAPGPWALGPGPWALAPAPAPPTQLIALTT